MTRVIALEEGLDDIGEYLRSRGFQTVVWDDQSSMVDAIVYTGKKLREISNEDKGYSPLTSALVDDSPDVKPFGVLLVNAQDRTPEEVYQIIKDRVYEHIF